MTKQTLNAEKNMEEEMVKYLEKLLKLNERIDFLEQAIRHVYFCTLALLFPLIDKKIIPNVEAYQKLTELVQQKSELTYESIEAFGWDLNKLFMVVHQREGKS